MCGIGCVNGVNDPGFVVVLKRRTAVARRDATPRDRHAAPHQLQPNADLAAAPYFVQLISAGLRNRHAIGLQGDGLGLGATALAGFQGVDRRQLVGIELEVEDVEVLGDTVGLVDFGMTERPCCRCQRSMTWAGLFACASAIRTMVGSSSVLVCSPSR